ncbi:MAG: hypothetical protein ACR2PR_10645 [Pseudohongiellaceae bacterium]
MICPKCNHKLSKDFFTAAQKSVNEVINCPSCNVELTADMKKFKRAMTLSVAIIIAITTPIVISYILLTDPDIGTITIPYIDQIYGGRAIASIVLGLILGTIGGGCLTVYTRSRQAFNIVQENHYKNLKFSHATCPECNHGLPRYFVGMVKMNEIVNCPGCNIQLRVDKAKLGRTALLSLLVATAISSPMIFIAYRLSLDDRYPGVAFLLGSSVLALVYMNMFMYVWRKYAFKAA